MKFSVHSKQMLAQLTAVGKVVNPKSALSILTNFLFELSDNSLTITGTDTENTVKVSVPVSDTEGRGKFCLDARRVTELLKAMPDSLVTFDIDDATFAVTIKYTNGKYNLVAIRGDEFPLQAEAEGDVLYRFNIPSGVILNAFDRVSFAVGTETIRPQMMGIYWDIKPDSITFVATDTRVLAKYRNTQTAPSVEGAFTLPTKAVTLVRALVGKDTTVTIEGLANMVVFTGETFTLRAVLLKGKFPDYNRVIPTTHATQVAIDRNMLTDAVSRVSICGDSGSNLIKMQFSPMDVIVTAQNNDFSISGTETVNCLTTGDELTIGFSGVYLKGILGTLATQNIFIRMLGYNRPALFLPSENDEFGELVLLCMPMSIKAD